jgi:Ca2+-binding EF-hand superfamily protein
MVDENEIIAAFQSLTSDGGSTIPADDLRRCLTTMGDKFTDSEVDEMIKDAGGGSKIDYAKFVKSFSAKAFDDGKELVG